MLAQVLLVATLLSANPKHTALPDLVTLVSIVMHTVSFVCVSSFNNSMYMWLWERRSQQAPLQHAPSMKCAAQAYALYHIIHMPCCTPIYAHQFNP